jgi:septum formation protein
MSCPTAKLVLASASPRRLALLRLLGLEPSVDPADIDESRRPHEHPREFARRLAEEKCRAVANRHKLPVIAADTVVALGNTTLGKPHDLEDATAMLRDLAGRSHEVHTGVAVNASGSSASLVDTTEVRFRELDEATLNWYVRTGESMGKAGAYAVQGAGGLLVESVAGSPQTVVGLPIHVLPTLFARIGVDFLGLLD